MLDMSYQIPADFLASQQSLVDAAYEAGFSDGSTQQKTLDQAAYDALNVQYQAALAEIQVLEGGSTPPPPPSGSPFDGPAFGLYKGGNSYPNTPAGWAKDPNVASFYEGGAAIWNGTKVTLAAGVKAAAADPKILFMQIAVNPPTTTFTQVTAGAEDTMWAAITAALDALGKPYLLARQNEADTAAHNPGGQTGAQYVAAVNHVAKIVAKSKHGSTLVWLAGFEAKATLETFIAGLDQSVVHDLGLDPYDTGTHPATETPTQTFAAVIAAAKAAGWTGRIHIAETGIVVDKGGKTEAQLEAWATGLPQTFKDYPTLSSIVWFDDNSGGKDYVPTTSGLLAAYGKACAAIVG